MAKSAKRKNIHTRTQSRIEKNTEIKNTYFRILLLCTGVWKYPRKHAAGAVGHIVRIEVHAHLICERTQGEDRERKESETPAGP